MYDAFGIVNSASRNIYVEGMQDYRPIGAFSFLGRYRVIDFPISNMSNSGIDRIQVYVNHKPRSLVEHVGTGRHYNINSKSGRLHLLFSEARAVNDLYNTDIASYLENMEYIRRLRNPYVVIAPNYMVYTIDYSSLIQTHVESGADITLLYHAVDNAKDSYLSCNILNLNKQKSSMFTLSDIVNEECGELDVRGVVHRGYFASITDFKSYYEANMALIDYKSAQNLFHEEWPIYTRTNDSCPTHYFDTASIKNSVVSNGCMVHGTIENSIIGRGCVIKKGAVIRNSIVLGGCMIGENVHIENQVVDKQAKITRGREIISQEGNPGYIKRGDML